MSSVNDRSKRLSGHPGDADWLKFADGEVTSREEKGLRAHLAACWQCRAALAEIQRAVGQCVQYREVVLRQAYPEPPQPWFDIYREFDRIEEQVASRSWFARLSDWLSSTAGSPRRVSYAALALTLTVVVMWQTWQLPAVQAANLLRRAVATSESRPQPKQPRRIRIRTKHATITRVLNGHLQAANNKDLEPVEALFRQAHYDWDDPLSARSFQRWRAQLPSKQDEVSSVLDAATPADRYHRIRTTTDSGELLAASLTLRATDLEPTSGTLEFRNHESVDIEALPVEDRPEDSSANAVSSHEPEPHTAAMPSPREEMGQPVTMRDELLVFKALHEIGADLDQPLDVTRTSDAVNVTGVGVPPERRQELRAALDPLPRVRLQFNDDGSASSVQPERHMSNLGPQASAEMERLQGRLESALGGRAAFTQVADRALESSDNMMTRIHALRRLAERYPTQVENEMTKEERGILAGLRRDHAMAVLAQTETLQKLLRPALRTVALKLDVKAPTGLAAGPWQAQTEQLFASGRQVDLLLAGTLAASPTTLPVESIPSELLAGLANLKAQAEGYEKMAREVQ
ncbi:hypothetical protein [uncultured Paludibaculum sp.]|uniref:hypothetical protein n=1 Tax=uncultured Paludibaculum sp. TaxID=1765020 RepID=UPI002AAB4A30|nr:hypothetical protein [uncultured Paludibaculum sp.]